MPWPKLKSLWGLPLVALLLCCYACDINPCGTTATGFAEKAGDFFGEVKEADFDATSPAWKSYDERLVVLVEDCYPKHEQNLTKAQDRAFWRGVSAYYVQRYGRAGAREFWRKLKGGVGDKIREASEGR